MSAKYSAINYPPRLHLDELSFLLCFTENYIITSLHRDGQFSTEEILLPLFVIMESVSLWSFEWEMLGDVVVDARKIRRSG